MRAVTLACWLFLAAQAHGNLLDGLEHHHGDHAHGDHAHGDHAHGDHGHGDHAHGDHALGDHAHGDHSHDHAHGDHGNHARDDQGQHAHGDHMQHAHGDHGNHAHNDHGQHAHGDQVHLAHDDQGQLNNVDHGIHAHEDHGEHAQEQHLQENHSHGNLKGDHALGKGQDHAHENAIANQDDFANALASDLGGSFLDLPAVESPFTESPAAFIQEGKALAENTGLSETFPVSEDLANLNDEGNVEPLLLESTSSPDPAENAIHFAEESNPVASAALVEEEEEASSASFSSGEPKQLSISGTSGPDYPTYAAVPRTSFSCREQEYGGYFADLEAECQVFHICLNGRKMGSFLCPNGTLFNQLYFVCDWWYNVDCDTSTDSYSLNARIGVVPE